MTEVAVEEIETEVRTETVTKYQCDSCGDVYDPDEINRHVTYDGLDQDQANVEVEFHLCDTCDGRDEYVRLKQYEADVEKLRTAINIGTHLALAVFVACGVALFIAGFLFSLLVVTTDGRVVVDARTAVNMSLGMGFIGWLTYLLLSMFFGPDG